MIRGLGVCLLLFQLTLGLVLPCYGGQGTDPQKGAGGEEPIGVKAEKLTVKERGKVIEAEGKVEIQRGESVLRADQVRVEQATQEVEAKGNVSVDDPHGTLKADAVRLNLEHETGAIENGDIFFKQPHLSLSGKRFQKFAGQVYHVDEGVFTTCLCESGPPHWTISAEEIDLNRDGTGVVRGATFHILDVPVLYLPYGFFPVRSERKTGLLFPKFGSSTDEGFRFQQPFFWAISKSSDATFEVDVESRARLGLLGEFRIVPSRNIKAQVNVSYFNEGLRTNEDEDIGDRTIADQEIPGDRWSVIATHRQTSSSGWLTYSDISGFSDDLFTRELFDRFDLDASRDRNLRTARYGRSRFGFFKSWGDIHLQGQWDFYQDFIQSDARTFQKTPQLSFWGRHPLGKTPLEFRWRAEGVNYVRRVGADGLRLDVRPEFLMPFRVSRYLSGSFDLALRETAYHLYQTEGVFDQNKSRELVEVRGRIGTSIGRVFAWNGSVLNKIKHVVEPELSYLFIPRTKDRDIPIIDGTDRINRRNLLTFSLRNRLWGRFAEDSRSGSGAEDEEASPVTGKVRELAQMRFALSYDIDKERKRGDSLSDLDSGLRINPVDYMALGVDMGLNPGPWQVTQAATHLSISDPRPLTHRVLDRDFMRPNRLRLSYRFIRRDLLAPLVDNANLAVLPAEKLVRRNVLGELRVDALFHVTDYMLLLYDSTYNARDGRFTSNRGGVKFLSKCECWTLSLSVNRTTNPDKTSFSFRFNLLGLGSNNLGSF